MPFTKGIALINATGTDFQEPPSPFQSGDFKISKDFGAFNDLNAIPSISPLGSGQVKLVLATGKGSETEVVDGVMVQWRDLVGDEWQPGKMFIPKSELNLDASAKTMIIGTVDTATNTHTPTPTEFQADDITLSLANIVKPRFAMWTSGLLKGHAAEITAYALVGGIGQFTVVGMPGSPANNDSFIVV